MLFVCAYYTAPFIPKAKKSQRHELNVFSKANKPQEMIFKLYLQKSLLRNLIFFGVLGKFIATFFRIFFGLSRNFIATYFKQRKPSWNASFCFSFARPFYHFAELDILEVFAITNKHWNRLNLMILLISICLSRGIYLMHFQMRCCWISIRFDEDKNKRDFSTFWWAKKYNCFIIFDMTVVQRICFSHPFNDLSYLQKIIQFFRFQRYINSNWMVAFLKISANDFVTYDL